ncbi:MAG TPA: ribosome assembly cofactor RimP [Bacteroidales bacterium]|jgi:ribosome maturation factor RimP|nr:ribosome assembly cofactor RimP [Bacteroidales bacterium]HNZ44000.1 ribosome assembly cofactor RimP [Bacteroidales bacterium]HPB24581.1 ribosome assembly cofactor RimP [Bacteroidales bacterium]HPI31335.1 ribosome assembly cofactor RimP [Bacteroidales bacterium]HQN15197.1 ribosome assembly cofactor RimP [Bacteroidales bacterium]
MITEKQIAEIVNEKLLGTALFLVEIRVKPGNFITVSIDSDSYVSINDCAALSRHIESKLDRETEDFELEVSSAGLDQPLKLQRQYLKNIGNDLKVLTQDGKNFTAALLGVGTKDITLLIPENKKKKTPEQEIILALKDIKEAKIIIKISNK